MSISGSLEANILLRLLLDDVPDQHQQREAALGVLHQPQIEGNMDLFAATFDLYLPHPKLSFEDCYLVCHTEATGASPLWTLDKKFASQTAAQLLRG